MTLTPLPLEQVRKVLAPAVHCAHYHAYIDEDALITFDLTNPDWFSWEERRGSIINKHCLDIKNEQFFLMNRYELAFQYEDRELRLSMVYSPIEYVELYKLLDEPVVV